MSNKALLILLILLSLLSTVCQADEYPFGKLFTDSGERKVLDQIRRGTTKKPADKFVLPDVNIPQLGYDDPGKQQLQFSGYVRRADGTTTLWVDGVSELTGQVTPGKMVDSKSAEFEFEDQVKQLKPGQIWLIREDSVAEVYAKPATIDSDKPVDDAITDAASINGAGADSIEP